MRHLDLSDTRKPRRSWQSNFAVATTETWNNRGPPQPPTLLISKADNILQSLPHPFPRNTMESTCLHVLKAPELQIGTAVTEDTDASEDPESQDDSIPFASSVTQNGIHVQVDGREALDLSLFETPRAEDNHHREHQRIHAINVSHRPWKDAVELPFHDAKMCRTWKPPPSREGTFTIDYLVPVKGIVALILLSYTPRIVYAHVWFAYQCVSGSVDDRIRANSPFATPIQCAPRFDI